MSARDAWHPLEQAKRHIDSISDAGLGLTALSSLMQCADVTKIDDACFSGLGMLLRNVGLSLLDSANHATMAIDKQPE